MRIGAVPPLLAVLAALAALGVPPGYGGIDGPAGAATARASASAPAGRTHAEGPGSGRLDLLTSIDGRGAAPVEVAPQLLGDLGGMLERRMVRALVACDHTHYFLDGPRQRGITYESLRLFERHLNAKYRHGGVPISVVVIPVPRDELLPRLVDGYGDIAAGALTVTPERSALVDFADPTVTDVREVVVTGPAGPSALHSLDDLSGREVWVRRSSSYRQSLDALSARLREAGRPAVVVRDVDEDLEDEDLLEMVAKGLIGTTVVDDYLASLWQQVLPGLVLHPDLALRAGGQLAWAVRKDAPALRREIDEFVATTRAGTLTGNVLLNRYLGTTRWIRNSLGREDLGRFRGTLGYFRRYAQEYRFDWLFCIAQAFQESRLRQGLSSPAGALGIMQVRPGTASDPRVGIADLTSPEANIHAGLKYLRWIVDNYFDDPGIDARNRLLFAFASYNAGPARIARLREQAALSGLDPDVWFGNVELVAARTLGDETVRYVRNILKYYVAYRLVLDQMRREQEARSRFDALSRRRRATRTRVASQTRVARQGADAPAVPGLAAKLAATAPASRSLDQ
jgi:membrane-bound lytic murein transglycosylase MltF